MSYILEALRRADAERSRGAVPGVHAQTAVHGAADGATRAPRSLPLAWVAVVGLLVLVGVLAWQLLQREPPRVVVAAAPVPVPAAKVAPPAAAPEVPAAPEAPPAPRKPAKRAVKHEPPAATPARAEPTIVKLADLPPHIRSQLPKLQVGGSVYSENPASRYLILDGQVFRENAEVVKGLTLEKIGLRSAVLRFKDYRYSIDY